MQFDLNEDQALLSTSTREFLEKEAPLAETRSVMEDSPEGYAKDLYAQLGDLGYAGLLLSEDDGGLGAIAFALVMAEMGRVAFPGPFLDLAVAVQMLANCTESSAREWQERAGAGSALVVIADGEDIGSTDPANPAVVFENNRVRGSKVFVPFGAQADALIVSTAQGLALVPRPATGWNATPPSPLWTTLNVSSASTSMTKRAS